jgi:hypothetical protein
LRRDEKAVFLDGFVAPVVIYANGQFEKLSDNPFQKVVFMPISNTLDFGNIAFELSGDYPGLIINGIFGVIDHDENG